MSIELSEEAFTLFYLLRERLVRVQELTDAEPTLAGEELAVAVSDLSDWIGPGSREPFVSRSLAAAPNLLVDALTGS